MKMKFNWPTSHVETIGKGNEKKMENIRRSNVCSVLIESQLKLKVAVQSVCLPNANP